MRVWSLSRLRANSKPAAALLTAALMLAGFGCATRSGTDRDSGTSSLGAEVNTPAIASRLAGLWRVEQVELFLDDGVSVLDADAKASIPEVSYRSDRISTLLNEQSLTVYYRLHADGQYTCTVDWAGAPERSQQESGRWSLDSGYMVRFDSDDSSVGFLSEARVVYADHSALLLRTELGGTVGGKCKIVSFRRGIPFVYPAPNMLMVSGSSAPNRAVRLAHYHVAPAVCRPARREYFRVAN